MNTMLILRSAIAINIGAFLLSAWQIGVFTACSSIAFVNLALLLLSYYRLSSYFDQCINVLNAEDIADNKQHAILKQLAHMHSFTLEANQAFEVVPDIGQDTFISGVNKISNVHIRSSLLLANEKIVHLRQRETENNWITQGVASIAELKHNGNDTHQYGFQVISTLVKYLQANQGGFYVLKNEGADAYFELVATYAYEKKKFIEKRINPGEGLLGQVYYDHQIIYITEVPKDYIKITSGLGEALPRSVCILPLVSEGKIYGAIEVASFNLLSPAELHYLEKIGERIGYNLGSIEIHNRTERLLQESQQMAQEVKAQEEELRQNMEELTSTQEQMRRKQTEMDAVLSSLSTVELDLHGCILSANEIFLSITGYQLADIEGKLYKNLIPQHGNDPVQYEIMWNSILSGRSFSGEFRIVNKSKKEMWMAGNFTPIASESGPPYKVMVISLFTTQDKEKLFELQEMVTALKNCFPMAELNPDLTFRSANDLFLTELGVKRLELKKMSPGSVLANGSFGRVENYLKATQEYPGNVVLDIMHKDGFTKSFNSTLIKISNTAARSEKGLLILRNEV